LKLVLRDEVFRASALKLAPLFTAALERRHRVEVDESGPLFRAWLAARSRDDRDEIQTAIDGSLEAEAREPARTLIEVADEAESDWAVIPPVITIDDALLVARAPFRVLVENSTSDRAFLLSVATVEQRRALERAEREGVLEFVQGGGIEQVTVQLITDAERSPGRRWSTFALVDGDALFHGRLSDSARGVRTVCQILGIACHVLKRRSIENYLTGASLRTWAEHREDAGRADRGRLVSAYLRMARTQRWYFHVKSGFSKRHACPLYASLSAEDIRALGRGFGDRVGKLFDEGRVLNHDMRREGALRELQPVLEQLIALLR
jgi:hypothetical protein